MKTKLPLIAALYCGLTAVGTAFTLDFTGVPLNTPIPPSLTINVAGYGDVRLDPVGNSALVVNNDFLNDSGSGAPALAFDMGEAVMVTFLAAPPINVDFDYVGVNVGESFTTSIGTAPQSFMLTLSGAGNGAGLFAVSFDQASQPPGQIPEPSASLLGAVGAALLVIRRRR